MAYPTVSGPYGFQPINLIGGQVFAGSTRLIPIAQNSGTSILAQVTGIASQTIIWYGFLKIYVNSQ